VPTRPTASARAERLAAKRLTSQRKRQRGPATADD
jgi:hypothetical protein